jgi:purine-binding chemotaxis protein CheW
MQFCTFFINDIYFGIDVMQVQEVVRFQEITPIPLAPLDIAGLINLRGQIITVIDLKCRLDMSKELMVDEQGSFNIILCTGLELVSLLVNEMGDVVEIIDSEIEDTPATLNGNIRHMLYGTYQFDDGFLLILNAEKILGSKGFMS